MQEDYKRLKRRILKLVKLFLRFVSLNNEKAKTKEKRQVHVIRKAERRASQIEYLLNNLGFTERAPVELHNILSSKIEADQKRPFARVLASWYANQRNDVDAIKCMKIIDYAVDGEKNQEHLNEATIMKAECYEVLGERRTGKKIILKTLKEGHDAAIYFVAMNFEDLILDRLKWINKAFSFYNFTDITFDPSYGSTPFDCLRFGNLQRPQKTKSLSLKPKVTVIMAVYNAENTIKTALDSLIAQTWSNLEILIVDDCSTDGTVNLVEEYCNMDNRLRLIIGRENCGPYVARNLAFSEATGEFVTCHDADDWSHPQKIEIQVLHLLQNAEVIGNTSQHIRVTPDLKVYRRGKFGSIILNNISSFMFRRDSIINNIGYWDCVRFRADDEFIRRIRQIFGNSSVINIPTGPLSFLRQHDKSLTGDKYFGMHGYLMGARKHYVDIQKHYHKKTNNLFYEFPMLSRPFPVPEPMWPKREIVNSERRHFDIIIASDFRLTGGNISAIEEEVEVQKQMKLRTGLFQLSRYDLRQNLKKTNPKILDLLDGDQVQMIVYGEKVECDCLIIRHPPVLQERQVFIPDVRAKNIKVIVDQAPYESYIKKGPILYDIKRCLIILREYFGKDAVWYPTGPLIRDILLKYHTKDINNLSLAEEDWVDIINVNEWKHIKRSRTGSKIRIGRHSRDHRLRWPENKEEMLSMYPDDQRYEIRVLGGADVPKKILGQLPGNWKVYKYDEISPKEFLADLDIFVYYTHPGMIETCDRVIVEALAAGVPAIIPPCFQKQFGEAAVYAQPSEVKTVIEKIMSSEESYQLQAVIAQEFVEKNYGYYRHKLRINN